MTVAFLSVESSFTGRRWVAREYDEREALALSQRFALSDVLARSLSARGVGLEEAPSFLEPRLRDLLPNPSNFLDMDKAVARFVGALQSGERVAVFGDYDADGATSSALLLRFGRAVGCDFRLYIPDRQREGYGPNVETMRKLAGEGIKLVICVDCGVTAHEALAAAKDAGVDVIVLDHHTAEPVLPTAHAVVNPNRLDEPLSASYGTLAAVGVTFLFVVAVNRALRDAGWYGVDGPQPDLMQWLDLVALGTVCDVVKLGGLNRAFVAQGLKVMEARRNAGIAALARVAGIKNGMDTYAAGFVLGPRINAGGRIGHAEAGAQLLATDDLVLAETLAQELHATNVERREIEARTLVEAEAMMAHGKAPLVFVAGDGWHAGVIGIVASRLKEKYHSPAIVVAMDGDVGKGSGRSIGNVDLGAAVIAARQAGLLINGGGHKMAAGLTVERGKVGALREFLSERIGKQLAEEPLQPTLTVDGLVSGQALKVDFVEKISALAPFGTGNPEPRFALADCRIVRADVVGEKHVSAVISSGGVSVKAIAFRAMENGLGAALLSQGKRPCHLAGHLRVDEWNGNRRVQMVVDDGAIV